MSQTVQIIFENENVKQRNIKTIHCMNIMREYLRLIHRMIIMREYLYNSLHEYHEGILRLIHRMIIRRDYLD